MAVEVFLCLKSAILKMWDKLKGGQKASLK